MVILLAIRVLIILEVLLAILTWMVVTQGKWGGNFYSDGATSAAGTFGVSKGTAGEEYFDSFVGYFSAPKL